MAIKKIAPKMFDFNKNPFNRLPLNKGDLFDLTCEYLISLFERINSDYHHIIKQATKLTRHFSNPKTNIDFVLLKNCFVTVERLIDTYSKLVKCSKLSLGQNIGIAQSKHIIFQLFSYSPNCSLQDSVLKLRNTQQHFEERLQDFNIQPDPILQLSYKGLNTQWEMSFGAKGYVFKSKSNAKEEVFDPANLIFHSYQQQKDSQNNKVLLKDQVRIKDIWNDTLQIIKLIKENLEDVIMKNGDCGCARYTYFGVSVVPSLQQ